MPASDDTAARPERAPDSLPTVVQWAHRVRDHGKTAATVATASAVCVASAAWFFTGNAFFLAPLVFAIASWIHLLTVFRMVTRVVSAEGEAWRRPGYLLTRLYAMGANAALYSLFVLGAAVSAFFAGDGPLASTAGLAFAVAAWGTAGLPLILAMPAYVTLWSLALARFQQVEDESRRRAEGKSRALDRKIAYALFRSHRDLLGRLARNESRPSAAIAHAQRLRELDEDLKRLGLAIPSDDGTASDAGDSRTWIDEGMCDTDELESGSVHEQD